MPKTITEVVFTDKQEKSLGDLGLMAFCDRPLMQKSFFRRASSVYLPGSEEAKMKGENDLRYILCVSRFAHHVKMIMRDKIGKFMRAEECERYLSQWFQHYCASSVSVSEEACALYPISFAKISVNSDPRGVFSGKYYCEVSLRLHGGLEGVQQPFRLISS